MFIGHFAAGLAIRSRVRSAPLGVLLAGTQFLDLVHMPLRAAGIEPAIIGSPPIFANWNLVELGYSHSLLVSIVYSVALGYGAARWWRSRAIGTAVGVAVFSHFVLDVLSHRPDMPLIGLGAAGDVKLGTNLAAHPLPFFLVEVGWCLLAWLLYDATNRRLLLVLAVWLAIWANNVFGFALPPESQPPAVEAAVALVGVGLAGVSLWWAARPGRSAAD